MAGTLVNLKEFGGAEGSLRLFSRLFRSPSQENSFCLSRVGLVLFATRSMSGGRQSSNLFNREIKSTNNAYLYQEDQQ